MLIPSVDTSLPNLNTESALRIKVILCICANCAWALFLFTLTTSAGIYIKKSRKFTIPEQGLVLKFVGVSREKAICFLALPQEQFLFAGDCTWE